MKNIVLGYESLEKFRGKKVRITRSGDAVNIQPTGPEMSFSMIMDYRTKQKYTPEYISQGLRTGHTFANLGVSAVLTITIGGNDYLITARQSRPDFKDSVLKLISGYLDSGDLAKPGKAIRREIAEEVLPVTSEGRLIGFRYRRTPIHNTYQRYFHEHKPSISLEQPARFTIPDLEEMPVFMNRKRISDPVVLYFYAPLNSAQLIFSYHLELIDTDPKRIGLSLHHSEDRPSKRKMMLEKILQELGIYLIRINKGRLTESVYNLSESKLVPIDSDRLVLSEAFTEKSGGIVQDRHITLRKYLKRRD